MASNKNARYRQIIKTVQIKVKNNFVCIFTKINLQSIHAQNQLALVSASSSKKE